MGEATSGRARQGGWDVGPAVDRAAQGRRGTRGEKQLGSPRKHPTLSAFPEQRRPQGASAPAQTVLVRRRSAALAASRLERIWGG